MKLCPSPTEADAGLLIAGTRPAPWLGDVDGSFDAVVPDPLGDEPEPAVDEPLLDVVDPDPLDVVPEPAEEVPEPPDDPPDGWLEISIVRAPVPVPEAFAAPIVITYSPAS
ncbi:MAG TPA: hypothetical protein VGG34_12915 [Opitutaceae bacterium]